LFWICSFRQRNSPVEEPKLPFTPANPSFRPFTFDLTLTLKDKRIVFDLHSYVIRRQPWKLGKDAVLSILFGDFDRRRPGDSGACLVCRQEWLEGAVKFVRHSSEERKRSHTKHLERREREADQT
jgi:hypothetical protein